MTSMSKAEIPETVRQFREHYRRVNIPRFYSGPLHLAFTASVLGGTIAWHLAHVSGLNPWEFLVLPVTLLFGNAVEYLVHRFPLHRVYPGLKSGYEIHSLEHHRFYTYDAMFFEKTKDFMMVLFPPWAPILVAVFCSLAGILLVGPLLSPNAGRFFAAMGTGCLLLYEALHGLAHFDDRSWAGRMPLVQAIRRHHRIHHDLQMMSRYNFNITFPIFDWILGTRIPTALARAAYGVKPSMLVGEPASGR